MYIYIVYSFVDISSQLSHLNRHSGVIQHALGCVLGPQAVELWEKLQNNGFAYVQSAQGTKLLQKTGKPTEMFAFCI